MRRTWLATGMVSFGLSAALLAGCDGSHGDDGLGGSEDNLKGRHKDAQVADAKADAEADPNDDQASACAAVLCPANSKCVVEQVQCVRAPCPPIAHCEPIAPEPVDASAPATCAATTCPTGTVCTEAPEGAKCVEPTSGASCAATLCKVGTTCIDSATGAQCIELKCTAKCSAGQHCELHEVQCIKAPCYPVPTCVDDVNACSRVRCKAGTHCELKEVQCFAAPCDPVAECVAD